eukprot:4707209-Pyramimonas_sp.AAC.1
MGQVATGKDTILNLVRALESTKQELIVVQEVSQMHAYSSHPHPSRCPGYNVHLFQCGWRGACGHVSRCANGVSTFAPDRRWNRTVHVMQADLFHDTPLLALEEQRQQNKAVQVENAKYKAQAKKLR